LLTHFVEHLTSAAPHILYLYDLASKDCLFITGQTERILGYSPAVSFEDGLRKTVEWYRSATALT